MPNQIQKGYDFQTNQLVTADNLDALAQDATLRRGAISEQPAIGAPVESADLVIVDDVSDAQATTPKKVTAGALLSSNIPIVSSSISSDGSKLTVNNADGAFVNAIGYSATAEGVVSVASTAHGLSQNDIIDVICNSTSGASGSLYSGRFVVASVAVDSFTFASGAAGVSAGTCSYRVSGTSVFGSNVRVVDELVVEGKITAAGSVMKMPVGPTSGRPSNPVVGDFRYNTSTETSEMYDGVKWREMGTSPFELSGGDHVLEPEVTGTDAFVSGNPWGAGSNYLTTVTFTSAADASKYMVGQYVEISTPSLNNQKYEGVVFGYPSTTTRSVLTKSPYQEGWVTPTNVACVIRKSGNHKIHVFTNTGTFTTGDNDGEVEVFLVGGGGGARWAKSNVADTNYSFGGGVPGFVGGNGGGVRHEKRIKLSKNTVYAIDIGAGGLSAVYPTSPSAATSTILRKNLPLSTSNPAIVEAPGAKTTKGSHSDTSPAITLPMSAIQNGFPGVALGTSAIFNWAIWDNMVFDRTIDPNQPNDPGFNYGIYTTSMPALTPVPIPQTSGVFSNICNIWTEFGGVEGYGRPSQGPQWPTAVVYQTDTSPVTEPTNYAIRLLFGDRYPGKGAPCIPQATGGNGQAGIAIIRYAYKARA